MTHNDVFTSVRSFHSGEMGEWENVKDVGSLAVNIKHKADRPIAVLYHKKNQLAFIFIHWLQKSIHVPLDLCFRAPRFCKESECQLPGYRWVSLSP